MTDITSENCIVLSVQDKTYCLHSCLLYIHIYSLRGKIQAFKVTFKYESMIDISDNKNTAVNNTLKIMQWYVTRG